MKNIMILGAFMIFILVNCSSPSEPMQGISEVEKIEIMKFEMATKVLETKIEEIEFSTKELQELLKEL